MTRLGGLALINSASVNISWLETLAVNKFITTLQGPIVTLVIHVVLLFPPSLELQRNRELNYQR